jgi:aromatic-L-amino-acid/L-tryptophan decarboxylase
MESQEIHGFMNPLEMSQEEMRNLGYRVIETVIEHFEQLRYKPVTRVADRLELEQRLCEPIPEKGTAINKLLDQLHDDVFSNVMHMDHPRFFAYVPGPINFVSVMADALVSGFNIFSGSWQEGSGAAMIELVTIDWLRQLCGFPEMAGGLFVSGGSMANLTALAVARQVNLGQHCERAVVYFSDQTHSSVRRAAKALGFNTPQIRILSSDEHLRLALDRLQRQVAMDRQAGMKPFCVVANAGSTNTGVVDPLTELASFCKKEGLWLHADAAYGGGAILCDEGRSQLRGAELVDSFAIDPHKWLFQPYGMGCLLVKNAHWLSDTFKIVSDYGKDAEPRKDEVNFCDLGIELTRRFRALKLWLSLKTFGVDAFRKAVSRTFTLARIAEATIAKNPNCELVTPAQLGIVTFRFIGAEVLSLSRLNALNREIVGECIQDGFAMVSSTELKGNVVLRLCLINPQTTEADIEETVQMIVRLGNQLTLS